MLARWFPQNDEVRRSSAPVFHPAEGLFDEALSLLTQARPGDRALTGAWAAAMVPPADVVETADAVRVSVDLPGYDPGSFEVRLDGDTLTIRAERRQQGDEKAYAYLRSERPYGSCTRSFVLPATIDGSKCEASYQHGVLTVALPKREEARPRTVAVQVRS